MIQDVWDICEDNICQQKQPIMDLENGVIVKIYKSWVDPILDGGRLHRLQTNMGISSGPMTYERFQFFP